MYSSEDLEIQNQSLFCQENLEPHSYNFVNIGLEIYDNAVWNFNYYTRNAEEKYND